MNSLLEWAVDGCGGYLRKNSGMFTSPEYPNFYPVNGICEWRIETDPGTKVQIVINELDLEGKNSKLKIDREGHLQILKCKIKLRGIQSETFNQNLM